MIYLRFTSTKNEKGYKSTDQVNKVEFNGLCAYDITDEVDRLINEEEYEYEEAIQFVARKQAEFDNWHCHNAKGNYVVFDGDFKSLERDNMDYLGNRAVIASIEKYIGHGNLKQLDYGYCWNGFILSK